MVRKWSYLSTFNLGLPSPPTLVYGLKVFKSTTRFKKYNLPGSITSFVRKNNAKRKHRNNWLNLLGTTKYWSSFFLKNKKFVRYYQSIGLANKLLLATSTTFFYKYTMGTKSVPGLFITSCPKSIVNFFVDKGVLDNIPGLTLKHTNRTLVGVNNLEFKSMEGELGVGLPTYDYFTYPNDLTSSKLVNSYSLMTDFGSLNLSIVNKFYVFVYQILIHLTLYSSILY